MFDDRKQSLSVVPNSFPMIPENMAPLVLGVCQGTTFLGKGHKKIVKAQF